MLPHSQPLFQSNTALNLLVALPTLPQGGSSSARGSARCAGALPGVLPLMPPDPSQVLEDLCLVLHARGALAVFPLPPSFQPSGGRQRLLPRIPPGCPRQLPIASRQAWGQRERGQQSLLERALPARAQHTHGHACSPRTAAGLGNAARAGQHGAKQHPTSVPAFICAPLGLAGRSRDLPPAPNKLSDYIRLICFEVPTAIRLHNPSLYPAEIHLYLRIFLFVLVARLLLPRRVSKCQSAQDNTYTHLLN